MHVTRDVIYDLLPAYFAGDVSADTRALIDEFFRTDPEFGRMAERFRTLQDDGLSQRSAESAAARERDTFHRVKTRIKRRRDAVIWAMGALMAFGTAVLAMLDGRGGLGHPGMLIGIVFAAVGCGTWFASRSSASWAEALDPGQDRLPQSGKHKRRRTG